MAVSNIKKYVRTKLKNTLSGSIQANIDTKLLSKNKNTIFNEGSSHTK